MKLKTEFQDEDFKLGEVADVNIATMPDGRIKAQVVAKSGGVHTFFYDDLKTFTNDWEDAPEEPKEYWYISDFGYVFNHEINNKSVKSTIEEMKSIGNYFLSKEEAEKAVEKLRAWKRVKRDLVSLHWQRERDGSFSVWGEFKTGNTLRADVYLDIHSKDLDICFGGEE